MSTYTITSICKKILTHDEYRNIRDDFPNGGGGKKNTYDALPYSTVVDMMEPDRDIGYIHFEWENIIYNKTTIYVFYKKYHACIFILEQLQPDMLDSFVEYLAFIDYHQDTDNIRDQLIFRTI